MGVYSDEDPQRKDLQIVLVHIPAGIRICRSSVSRLQPKEGEKRSLTDDGEALEVCRGDEGRHLPSISDHLRVVVRDDGRRHEIGSANVASSAIHSEEERDVRRSTYPAGK